MEADTGRLRGGGEKMCGDDPAPPEIGRGSKRALTHRAGKSNRLIKCAIDPTVSLLCMNVENAGKKASPHDMSGSRKAAAPPDSGSEDEGEGPARTRQRRVRKRS